MITWPRLIAGVLLLAAVLAFSKRDASAHDPRIRTGSSGIVMVTAEWCGYCRKQESELRAANVPYEAIDFDTAEGKLAMSALNARGVPVTVIGQQVLRGYDINRLRTAVAPLGHQIP